MAKTAHERKIEKIAKMLATGGYWSRGYMSPDDWQEAEALINKNLAKWGLKDGKKSNKK